MSRVSQRIENSGFATQTVQSAVSIIGRQMNIPWADKQDLYHPGQTSEESYRLENFVYCILQKGKSLLENLRNPAMAGDPFVNVMALEDENGNFARDMSELRRSIAHRLALSGEQLSGLGHLDQQLNELMEILKSRGASPLSPMMEETIHAFTCDREKELAHLIQAYIKEKGWGAIPIGEREEAILSLCQHLYTTGDFAEASDLLVDAMEAGIRDPLVYYAYFILGSAVGEYEAAMEGYNVAISALPVLSLAPADRYEIQKIIHKNSIKTSCLGVDSYTGQPVTINILMNPSANIRNAIQNSARLKHSKVCEVLNYHEINKKRPCLVTEYLEGPSFEYYILEEGQLPTEIAMELVLQVVGSIANAHDQGIIHGNIHPGKLVFHQDEIKITDFGLASSGKWGLPADHEILEKNIYVAPELFHPGVQPDMCSDIYSLAKTIYFIFEGQHPHCIQPKSIPGTILPILARATSSSPEERYQNATEFLSDLAQKSGESLAIPAYAKSDELISTESSGKVISLENGKKIVLPEKFVYQNGTVHCQSDDSIMMIVPEGSFSMGSMERQSEGPIHEVYLGSYLIDRYPVTNAQYASFLEYIKETKDNTFDHPEQPKNKDHTPKGWGTLEYQRYSDHPDNPVIFVDWWDAWSYASWAGKTLPTEAQWEKAARGTDNRKYPWGDKDPDKEIANYNNHHGKTTTVDIHHRGVSPYGCIDMVGNVWEWCLDTYDKDFYRSSPKKNPVNLAKKPARVLRGGSWNDPETTIRTSCRGCWINIVRYAYIGFRCAYILDKD